VDTYPDEVVKGFRVEAAQRFLVVGSSKRTHQKNCFSCFTALAVLGDIQWTRFESWPTLQNFLQKNKYSMQIKCFKYFYKAINTMKIAL